MPSQSYSWTNVIVKKLIRIFIAVVGLIILMGIFNALPMIKNTPPIIIGSYSEHYFRKNFPSYSFEKGYSNVIAAEIAKGRLPFFNGAGFSYRKPTPSNVARVNASNYALKIPVAYILPASIVDASFATIIFAFLIVSFTQIAGLIKANSRSFPEFGMMMLYAILIIIVTFAGGSYYNVLLPLIGLGYANLYEWLFLLLGILPLIGIIVIGSRNLDTMTEILFSSSKKALESSTVLCPDCGSQVEKGIRFCPHCGYDMSSINMQFVKKCPSCGTENKSDAKFCKGCGKPIQ